MRKEVMAILPQAEVRHSYDENVWFELSLGGKDYQIFDMWNFGVDISEDDPARFSLARIDGEPGDDDSYIELGRYPSAKAAAEALL